MVKASVIEKREMVEKPKVNYRALDSLNYSMIKTFDSDPIKFFEEFKLGKKRKENKSLALLTGDLVDVYILEARGDEEDFNALFDDKFALFEDNKGSSQVYILADVLFEVTKEFMDEDNGEIKVSFDARFSEAVKRVQAQGKYKGKTEDAVLKDFYEKGYTYFNTLMDNIGKNVVDTFVLHKSKEVADMLLSDAFTADVFAEADHLDYYPKFPIEWEYTTTSGRKVACKSEVDILKVDHDKKVIYLKDLKTTYDNEGFDYAYIKQGYYLQAGYYYLAVQYWAKQNNMGDYEISPMEFIVGDTSVNKRRPIRYQTSDEDLLRSLKGFTLKGVYYRGVHELMDDICWAEDNDIWNCSREMYNSNGKVKLNINYE